MNQLIANVVIPQPIATKISRIMRHGGLKMTAGGCLLSFVGTYSDGYWSQVKVVSEPPRFRIEPILWHGMEPVCVMGREGDDVLGDYVFEHDGKLFTLAVQQSMV